MQDAVSSNPDQKTDSTRDITEKDVDFLIDCQRQAIRYYLRFAIGLAAAGAILLIAIFAIFGGTLTDSLKSLVGIGCGFVSSLSALQIKEITPRTQSMKVLLLCKTRMSSPDEDVRKKYEDLVWQSLEKMALG
jgi:hypothetical protein